MSFKKRKLSREALDAFASHFTDKQYPNSKDKVHYTTGDGQIINFIPSAALVDGMQEYHYLLGQTFPYHDNKQQSYPVTDLAFIQTKDGKKEPWARSANDITTLVTLGAACKFILIQKGPNNAINIIKTSNIKPVIHDEGIEHEPK